MLSQIFIKKFLYFKDIEVSFSEKLNVITGETGAGKSLIIDAILFALGERGKFEEGDYVELVFDNVENEYAEDSTLIVARQVKNGKNVYYINGRRATLSTLKEATSNIIELHSQHHQQKLLKKEFNRQILDSFAQIKPLLDRYSELYNEYKKLLKEEEDIKNQQINSLKELDILKFQLNELESASLKEGEKEELEKRYEYLSNINFIKENIYSALHLLEEDEKSVNIQISSVKKLLEKISNVSGDIKQILENLDTALSILSDVSYSLSKIEIEVDPKELEFIESRLDTINWLEKKYNTDEKGLIQLIDQIQNRISALENLEERLPIIEEKRKKVYEKVVELAEKISKKRKEASSKFSKQINEHLKDLALKNSIFKVLIEEKPLDQYGKDRILFLFSANPGFEPKPIDETASGGEISRLALALKLVSGQSVDCMIFDEIDTGIGGKTGILMADKLKSLASKFQVILITHLPQVAAVADKHIYVDKLTHPKETIAVVKELSLEEKRKEIARMLSGSIDESSIQLANKLIKQ
ncbi:MAG: DNA repair protein RecN [Aquificae bacterium]|nr:DNA repair protein RecN [Aquificota bacterium]